MERGPGNGRHAKQNVRGLNISVGAREIVPIPRHQLIFRMSLRIGMVMNHFLSFSAIGFVFRNG
jgi:hypothetical protein